MLNAICNAVGKAARKVASWFTNDESKQDKVETAAAKTTAFTAALTVGLTYAWANAYLYANCPFVWLAIAI